MTFAIAMIGAVLAAASLVLHVVAPRTKTQWDDKAEKLVDSAIEKLK